MSSTDDLALSPEFRNLLSRTAGERGIEVAEALMEKGEASSEELSEELEIPSKTIRNTLYKLYEEGIVDFGRTRDEGWYSYQWRVEAGRAMERRTQKSRRLLHKLKERLEFEREGTFFACDNRCSKLEYGKAIEQGFSCPSCGKEMKPLDNEGLVSNLERQIQALNRKLAGG